jgi:ribosomal protein S18 acetylase RimI-like enzyme
MPDIIYRTMTPDDYDEVEALWRASEGVGLSVADTREGVEAFLERNPGLSTVATCDGRVIGVVLCGHDGRRGYLSHLAVARPHRLRGIGRALADRTVGLLARAGIDKCHIVAFVANKDALAYWRAAGWTERTELTMFSKFTREGAET